MIEINQKVDKSTRMDEISNLLSHQFSCETLNREQHFTIPDKLGKGSLRRMRIKEGMEIITSDIELFSDIKVYIEPESNYFEMNFCLSGKTICEMENQKFKIQGPKSHVYYAHHTKTELKLSSNVRNRMVEVRISPERLLDYFGDEADKNRVKKVLKDQKGHMTPYELSPLVKKRIFEIMQCPYRGTMKKMYYEAKAMELIILFFQEEIFCSKYSSHSFNPEEIKKLKKARDIVLNCLDHPYSIKELAQLVGLNEFQLKKGFRELYGITIFGFIRSQRMEQAARLMKMEGYNVSETASIIGYSNFSNFTVAFRKHFGCNPIEYLKDMKERKY